MEGKENGEKNECVTKYVVCSRTSSSRIALKDYMLEFRILI